MANHLIWDIDPQIFSFAPVPRWYGLIFALGIVGGFLLMKNIFVREDKDPVLADKLLVYVFISMLLGMRLGHCLFYEPATYLAHPLRILKIWEGGYASHGGFAGLIVGIVLFARRYRDVSLMWLLDRMTMPAMFAAGMIRVANFFNSEMIGHPADVPWAIVFKLVDEQPRHPGQLYEAVGFFAIFALALMLYLKTPAGKRSGYLFGLVLILGFSWRFFCEFFKEDQVGFEAGMALNMGQLLSLPFVAAGIFVLIRSWRQPRGLPAHR
jgi:prolipoprotein diacylglyceryl transferase